MQQALLVRLRPLGPWRNGPSDGARDRVDTLFRSDRLFSAVTLALKQLGLLDAWLDATARSEKPAVAFSSLFPFQGDVLYITPPAHLWPPPSSLVTSPSPVFLTKVRWRAAHFVPLSLVDSLLTGQSVLADQWIPDPESGCLLRRDRPSSSPFRTVSRTFVPVDRVNLTGGEAENTACVEFEAGSGLWTVLRFRDDAAQEAWSEPLRSAFRLLADTGLGGGRSKGWGQVQAPEFENGSWPSLLLPKVGRVARNDVHEEQTSRSYYLLSVYSPAAHDTVNWSGGQYEVAVRNGRVEGAGGQLKKSVRMVMEGCILDAAAEPVGTAVNVAPEGLPHPVYRSGIALALLVPPPKPQSEDRRAIEEIVPPELEATPFPMPPAVVEEHVVESAKDDAANLEPGNEEQVTKVIEAPHTEGLSEVQESEPGAAAGLAGEEHEPEARADEPVVESAPEVESPITQSEPVGVPRDEEPTEVHASESGTEADFAGVEREVVEPVESVPEAEAPVANPEPVEGHHDEQQTGVDQPESSEKASPAAEPHVSEEKDPIVEVVPEDVKPSGQDKPHHEETGYEI